MRLIDADALKKKLQSRRNNSEEDFDRGFDLGIGVAMNLIHNAPTIEPRIEYGTDGQPYRLFMSGGQVVPDTLQGWRYEERPQDEWNYIQSGMCVCPSCGAMPHELYKNYCAKCGAKLGTAMREEEDK